jgi:hypothetical protein
MSGIHDEIEPVAAIPQISSEPWPCCQTSVITPHAAPTLNTLRITAFSGSSSERNARASRRKVSSEINAIISGNAP